MSFNDTEQGSLHTRKGQFNIVVTDENGEPVAGSDVAGKGSEHRRTCSLCYGREFCTCLSGIGSPALVWRKSQKINKIARND